MAFFRARLSENLNHTILEKVIITFFNSLILKNGPAVSIVEVFEALGFEKRHQKDGFKETVLMVA